MNKGTGIIAGVLVSSVLFGGTSVQAATKNKAINYTVTSELQTLNQATAADTVSESILYSTGQGLYRMNGKSKVVLADAKSVDISKDGKTYTFHLKSGLQYSNGTKVTAQDYVYGFQQTLTPKNQSTAASSVLDIVGAADFYNGKTTNFSTVGVKALDSRTVQIKLTVANPDLPKILTGSGFYPENKAFMDSTDGKYGSTAATSLSNGPYILKDFNGSSTTFQLVKNPNYVDAAKVKTPQVNYTVVKDNTTGYNLFQSGKVDYTTLNATQVKSLKKSKEYRADKTEYTTYMQFNLKRSVLNNKKIRQAMEIGVNKKELANDVLTGSSTPATTFAPANIQTDHKSGKDFSKAYQTTYNQYNAKKAAKLFAAGMKEEGKQTATVTILAADTSEAKDVSVYLKAQLEKNLKGLTVNIKNVPKPTLIADMRAGNFDIVYIGWEGDASGVMSYEQVFTSDGIFSFGNYKSATYDALIKKAKTTDATKEKERVADLGKADQMLQKDAALAPLGYTTTSALLSKQVKNLQINAYGDVDFMHAVKK